MMNKDFLKSKVTPIIAIILCYVLYLSGYFQILFAIPIVLLASGIEYGKGLFKSLGFQRSRRKAFDLLIIAPLAATGMVVLYVHVLVPGVTYLTGQPMDYSMFEQFEGNIAAIVGLLIFAAISGGFGEEILFRGYFMRQFTKFFGNSALSIILNIIIFGVIFGWIHMYQGISGQIITGIAGVMLATIFHLRKDDLWFTIAVHGFFDLIALGYYFYIA